jgi:hypothetical protein
MTKSGRILSQLLFRVNEFPAENSVEKRRLMSLRFPASRSSLTGVVLLRLEPLGQYFEGRWWGYTKEGKIMGGRVEWQPIPKP